MDGPLLISPNVFEDGRGFFMESWNSKDWDILLKENKQISVPFLQDNHSKSSAGVLRGLHYQKEPFAQGKLVRCIAGEIFDVAVDIRRSSSTFGKYVCAFLSADNKDQLWIPVGFAHGFLTISEYAEVAYKATNYWNKAAEKGIKWNDPSINIEWPKEIDLNKITISVKDSEALLLSNLKSEDLL